jgi:hypothetical protein
LDEGKIRVDVRTCPRRLPVLNFRTTGGLL